MAVKIWYGISAMMLARMKAFHEYALLGRSLTSYRALWVTKCGWI
jgi:hypothetical protein